MVSVNTFKIQLKMISLHKKILKKHVTALFIASMKNEQAKSLLWSKLCKNIFFSLNYSIIYNIFFYILNQTIYHGIFIINFK
jgi:hypothetical protein